MKGKTALVTGASRGIGAEIAKRLERDGVRVVAPSRKEMDLSSNKSIERYLKSLRDSVDILVNNAGTNILGAGHELKEGEFQEVLQLNLLAPLKVSEIIAEGMKKRRYGRIVNLSSIWSLVTRERRVTYSASKAALNGLTRSLAIELAPYGILVNAVAPGYVDTDLTRRNNSPDELEAIAKSIPLGRLAEPREIAECVAFLASEKNTYITGHVMVADGGFLCR